MSHLNEIGHDDIILCFKKTKNKNELKSNSNNDLDYNLNCRIKIEPIVWTKDSCT